MQTEIIPAPDLARAEARMPRWMAAFAFIGTLVAWMGGDGARAAAFALGGCIGILNFFWLRQAALALLSSGRTRAPKGLVAKVALRYPLGFGAVFLVYSTGWLPPLPMIAGLFVPALGVLVGCLGLLREGFRGQASA